MPAGRLTRRRWTEFGAARMLRDRGVVQTYVPGATNAYGYESGTPVYTDGDPIPLTYQPGAAREATATVLEIPISDATVFLPLSVAITSQDRIKVTHRNGRLLAQPLICTLVSAPIRDVNVQTAQVQTAVEHS